MLAERADVSLLIELVALQDRVAFRKLYRVTNAKLFGVALRILNNRADAEDALQDIYLNIWHYADRYRRGHHSPISWLVVIARNKSIDAKRKRTPLCSDVDTLTNVFDSAPSPEQSLIVSDDGREVANCLSRLPGRRADLVRGAYVEGHTYQELATKYDLPIGTVRNWLRRSMMELAASPIIASRP